MNYLGEKKALEKEYNKKMGIPCKCVKYSNVMRDIEQMLRHFEDEAHLEFDKLWDKYKPE